MICTYTYKGRTFNSEAELDDFLLEKDKYLSKFEDIVFSMEPTTAQLNTYDVLDIMSKKALDLKSRWEAERVKYTEDGTVEEHKRPYAGVNEFLSGLRNSDGKLFFPEFVEHNYWTKRYVDWSKGEYTPDESELFGVPEHGGPKLDLHPELLNFQADPSWNAKTLQQKFEAVTTSEQDTFRKKMEDKWKNQALFGDIAHFIGQKLFSVINSGPDKGKLWIDVVDTRYDLFLKQIDPDKYDDEKKPIRKKFTDDHIQQTIQYFKNLKQELETTLGDSNLMFVAEPIALGDLSKETNGINRLVGRIDLLVIDSSGNAHVIDYKTSPKPYAKYNDAKKLGYMYQLASYTRILAQNGLKFNNIRSFVAPIQLKGFKPDTEGYKFDEIKADIVLEELTRPIRTSESIINNLNEIISIPENLTATSENLISKVDSCMKTFFPEYGKKKTEDEVRAMIEADKGFEKRTDLEKPYGYFPKGSGSEPIVADSEAELVKKVMVYYNSFQEQVKGHTSVIKTALKEGIQKNTTDVSLPQTKNENPAWLRNVLSKYLNDNWEVLEGDAYDSAEEFGLIFVQNKHTRHVEVITTSLNYLPYNPSKNPKMKNLTYGLGESDIVENSKPNSDMLEATNGNIRLMETLLVLNNMEFSDDVHIGQIHVINPIHGTGTWSPNEQMLYSFDKLMRLAQSQGKDVGENRLEKGKGNVKFATKAQLALLSLKNIMNITGTRTGERFGGMASSISDLDKALVNGNKEEVLLQLEELKSMIENDKELSRYIKNPSSIITESYHIREAITTYAQILWAIAEYKGYDFKQQLKDHDKIILNINGSFNGLYAQDLENPGNYASNILNTASRVMQEAYQNVRDSLSKDSRAINQAVETLKQREGFSKASEYTFGNQASLYTDIVYKTQDGDLMVKNPWDPNCRLSAAKIEFTKMFLMEINKDRFPNKSEAELEVMAKNGDYDFFKLPLLKASRSGKAAQRSFWSSFKTRIKRLFDKSYYKDKVSDFLSDEAEIEYRKSEEVFKMNNMMDIGNGPNRKAFIAKQLSKDSAYFEVDLENILLAHKQAYTIQREMNSRLSIIKAAAFSLKMMGDYMGQDFSADYQTIEDTVRNKIKNESLIPENMKVVAGVTKELQQAASWMALAFAPIQMSGQMLNGLFTNMKLHWTYDREMFSMDHLKSSFAEVSKDFVHFGTTPTLCEAINKVFGINDMDMNTYAQNLSTNKHGIFHFLDRYAFKMSSRPDFYNRMTLFLSQMKADGCYEAVSLDANGNLKYDCTKDARYKALWDGSPKTSDAYKKALSRYISVAQQFVSEGAKNPDGTLFEFDVNNPKPLPRMYTVQEAESRKDVADSMYGYYDHTKKALFFGRYLGGLIGQMRTYWSAKKNQYLATPGSNKIKGRYVQRKDDQGNPLYYEVNENGEVDYTKWTTNNTGFVVEQWQGDYAEGVFVTLWGIVKEVWNNDNKSLGGMMETIRTKFLENPDENYRRCYVNNLKLITYDLCMAILLGALCFGANLIYDDLEDEAKKSQDLNDVLIANTFGLAFKTLNYAKLDFFWWESIFGPTIDWNPYTVSSLSNTIKQVSAVATGDKNAFDAMCQMFGFARQNKPIFKYLGQQTRLFEDE